MRSLRTTLDIALVLAVLVVGVLAYPRAKREYYLWLLGSPNPEQAAEGRDGLVGLGSDAVPDLTEYVHGEAPNPAARLLAFEALMRIQDPRVVALALEVAAHDWDQELQSEALEILARANVPEAKPIFRELIEDPDSRIRFAALDGLVASGDPGVLPALVARLEDKEFLVAASAAAALGRLTGQPLPFPNGDDPESRAIRARTIAAWKNRLAVLDHGRPDEGDATATARADIVAPHSSIAAPEAPNFAVTTLDGSVLELIDLRGRPVLINFWASWCVPCIKETDDLVETAKAMGDDAVVIGIAAEYKNPEPATRELKRRGADVTDQAIEDLQTQAVRRFAADHQIPYPVAFGDTDVLEAYNAYALPTTVIVRPDGVIYRRIIGERSKDYFIQLLREAAKA